MDIQKTMESLLEGHARFDQAMAKLTSYQIEAEARHLREMADLQARHVKHDREMAELRAELRRAEHLAIEEFRRERQRLEMYQGLVTAEMQRLFAKTRREVMTAPD